MSIRNLTKKRWPQVPPPTVLLLDFIYRVHCSGVKTGRIHLFYFHLFIYSSHPPRNSVVGAYRTCRRGLRQLRRTCHLKTVTFLINDAGMMQLWVAIERIYTIL